MKALLDLEGLVDVDQERARLVANRAAWRLKNRAMVAFVDALAASVAGISQE